jgi:hypothetical protein
MTKQLKARGAGDAGASKNVQLDRVNVNFTATNPEVAQPICQYKVGKFSLVEEVIRAPEEVRHG